MKRFIDTLRNIFKIQELRQRILLTLGLLLIYRLGSYVVLPGIDPVALKEGGSEGGGLAGILDLFAGGAFSRASIFALGIMPYISASIAVQLLTMAVPAFQKMQKDGESGRNKLNQVTRYLTIAITAAQAVGFVINLKSESFNAIVNSAKNGDNLTFTFWLSTVFVLIAGTMFVMWLGEKITDKGLGNGISLIIMVGIAGRLPQSIIGEFQLKLGGEESGGLLALIIEMLAWLAIIIGTIALVQAVRKIPLTSAKRQASGATAVEGPRNYIPLKVNTAGVMPIIFAQAIMFLPATIAQFFPESDVMSEFGRNFADYTSVVYNVILAVLIILFTYFYTSLSVPANQMAEDLKKSNAFVPGIAPGEATSAFIDEILSKITLPGAIFLSAIAILPAVAKIFKVSGEFSQFFGGTSLLILVGVILDTLQQVESYLLMKQYDGLMSSGRVRGRRDNVEVNK
ncbi:MAG: preprotein translocase subunit SecY [Bacteroidia bacterium]|jgi:preprotein translocase subunit SecY